jgi:trimeric autotransporter adhesin
MFMHARERMKLLARFVFARRLAPTLLAFAALSSACTEGHDAASPAQKDRARLPLRATYAVTPSSSAAINRIRISVRGVPAGPQFGPFIFNVDPDQAEWGIPVELQLTATLNVIVVAELINVNNNVEAVLYSGRIGPIKVSPGDNQKAAQPIVLYAGDASNLDITSVQVTAPAAVLEGTSFQLRAATQGGGANPTVLWTALTPNVATVDGNGNVQTLLPGVARFEVHAGPQSAFAEVRVDRRMDKVVITPAAVTLNVIGSIADFSATVLDPRGQPFPGTTIVWSIADGAIAEATAPGKFRAKAGGKTTVTASVSGTPTLRGTAELIVDQKIAKLTITPTSVSIQSVGQTFKFTASARDASDNEVANPGFKWSSSAPAVATVDQDGLATGNAAGKAVITVEAGGLSASANVEVLQKAVNIAITPAQYEFTALATRTQLTAVARDANNEVVNRPVAWGTSNGSIVQVDNAGNALAVGNGTALVFAQLDGVTSTAAFTVRQLLAGISLNATSITLQQPRDRFHLVARAVDANNNEIPGLPAAISSSDKNVVIFEAGDVVAINQGTASIIVSIGGITATVPVTVVQGTVTPPPPPPGGSSATKK